MKTTSTPQPNLRAFLSAPLRVGSPQRAGNLTVFPIFGPDPACRYRSFAQAREQGFSIGELPGGASVNDLLVANPTGDRVLLFDGEEVLGAQQNRTFDVSVLVEPGTTLKVPVSCVEAGRWDASRATEAFTAAPQAANPRMRRIKSEAVGWALRGTGEARADQGEVWGEVSAMAFDHGVDSATSASHDIFAARRDVLDEICSSIEPQPNQIGAMAAIAGELSVLDLVSRPDVYRSLHPRLAQGYALDAIAAEYQGDRHATEVDIATARGFALLVSDAPTDFRRPGVGLGEEVRFATGAVAGSGLTYEGELIQLSAFPARVA